MFDGCHLFAANAGRNTNSRSKHKVANRLLHAIIKLIESKQRIHRSRSKPSSGIGVES